MIIKITFQNEDKLNVLAQLEEKAITMQEAPSKIREIKSLRSAQEVFKNKVEAKTVAEAKEKYPQHFQRVAKFANVPDLDVNEAFKVKNME